MSVASNLATQMTKGQILSINGEKWQIVAVATDCSKIVVSHPNTGKVKMIQG